MIVSWVIIALVVLIIGFICIKVSSTKSQVKLILSIILILFLFGTILVVYTSNKLELNTSEGFVDAAKIYFGWLANGFQNLKALVGNAIKMDWASTDGSFVDEDNEDNKDDDKVKFWDRFKRDKE